MPFLSIGENTLDALNLHRKPKESDDQLIVRLLELISRLLEEATMPTALEEIENMERE